MIYLLTSHCINTDETTWSRNSWVWNKVWLQKGEMYDGIYLMCLQTTCNWVHLMTFDRGDGTFMGLSRVLWCWFLTTNACQWSYFPSSFLPLLFFKYLIWTYTLTLKNQIEKKTKNSRGFYNLQHCQLQHFFPGQLCRPQKLLQHAGAATQQIHIIIFVSLTDNHNERKANCTKNVST